MQTRRTTAAAHIPPLAKVPSPSYPYPLMSSSSKGDGSEDGTPPQRWPAGAPDAATQTSRRRGSSVRRDSRAPGADHAAPQRRPGDAAGGSRGRHTSSARQRTAWQLLEDGWMVWVARRRQQRWGAQLLCSDSSSSSDKQDASLSPCSHNRFVRWNRNLKKKSAPNSSDFLFYKQPIGFRFLEIEVSNKPKKQTEISIKIDCPPLIGVAVSGCIECQLGHLQALTIIIQLKN